MTTIRIEATRDDLFDNCPIEGIDVPASTDAYFDAVEAALAESFPQYSIEVEDRPGHSYGKTVVVDGAGGEEDTIRLTIDDILNRVWENMQDWAVEAA